MSSSARSSSGDDGQPLVTGAGSGIGAAVARRLHDRGDHLVLLARSEARAAELVETYPGSTTWVADLADPESLEGALAFVELPGSLDSVLHVAGVVDLNPVGDAPLSQWREQFDVNLLAPAVLTAPACPRCAGPGGPWSS